MKHAQWIAEELKINISSVQSCLKLIEESATVAFIARYRKAFTGGLNEEQIEAILKLQEYYLKLQSRKETIENAIKDQAKWDDEKADQLRQIRSSTELEDFYLPYKRKKQSKADKALVLGLGSLAALIMKGQESELKLKIQEKQEQLDFEADQLLQFCIDICVQWITENQYLRRRLRQLFQRSSKIVSKLKDAEHPDAAKYQDYHNYEGLLSKLPSHRALALFRAEDQGVVSLKIGPDQTEALEISKGIIGRNLKTTGPLLLKAIKSAYSKSIAPSLAKEMRNLSKQKAEEIAIQVFAKNLRQLLAAPPLHQKRVLAIDPGFKSGCKMVCLDEFGGLLHNENIYPHPPQKEWAKAKAKLAQMVEAYQLDAIAVGNGTAGRETETLIQQTSFRRKVQVFSVSEAGASVYSASSVARKEFPQYDVTVRGAVSIGRRLQDPLAELVKVDPKAIGVGQYQHDLDAKKLDAELEKTVSSVVNEVGVELNQASPHLLKFVSGLGSSLAENIYNYREENGPFSKRSDLKKVKGLGSKAFEQCAGFLRIAASKEILDNTAIHPESYDLVKEWALSQSINLKDLISDKESLARMSVPAELAKQHGNLQMESLRDELLKAGRDQRGLIKAFSFDPRIKRIEDLRVGMLLQGLVNNITKFGAFVDLGIKQSGLVHVSEIADRFISDPNEELSLQQVVKVKVLDVDLRRNRIQLSIKQATDV